METALPVYVWQEPYLLIQYPAHLGNLLFHEKSFSFMEYLTRNNTKNTNKVVILITMQWFIHQKDGMGGKSKGCAHPCRLGPWVLLLLVEKQANMKQKLSFLGAVGESESIITLHELKATILFGFGSCTGINFVQLLYTSNCFFLFTCNCLLQAKDKTYLWGMGIGMLLLFLLRYVFFWNVQLYKESKHKELLEPRKSLN